MKKDRLPACWFHYGQHKGLMSVCVPCLSLRDGGLGAAGRDDRVQEDPDKAGPGDGRGDDGVPAEGGAAHCAGHHGDPAGGLDAHRG